MIGAAPPKAPTGSPPPMTFPSVVRSGVIPSRAWTPPRADPKAGHHLVEDQQRAVAPRDVAERAQKARNRQHESHVPDVRLDDHGRDAAGVPFEGRVDGGGVVVGHDERVGGRPRRDALRVRNADGQARSSPPR